MKKLLSLILVMSILFLSSCSLLINEVHMTHVKTPNVFENERFLLINNALVDKGTNTVYKLKYDNTIKTPIQSTLSIWEKHTYKVEFYDNVFKEYVFFTDMYFFFDYTITFNYVGEELLRTCTNKVWERDEMNEACSARISTPNDSCSFSFETFRGLGEAYARDLNNANQAILKFANVRYLPQNNGKDSNVYVISNPIGEEIWFSTTVTAKKHQHSADPIRNGIYKSEIFTYNTKTNEFKQICDYSKSGRQIIDLNENGFYTIGLNGEIKYFDYKTKKESLFHTLPSSNYTIYVTDKYFLAELVDDYYFYTKSN